MNLLNLTHRHTLELIVFSIMHARKVLVLMLNTF